jgi:hypothetical protein
LRYSLSRNRHCVTLARSAFDGANYKGGMTVDHS